MRLIRIDIRVRAHLHVNANLRFQDAEAHRRHRILIILVVEDVNLVIPTHQKLVRSVGQTEMVVIVEHLSVHRLLIGVNHRAPVDAGHEITVI